MIVAQIIQESQDYGGMAWAFGAKDVILDFWDRQAEEMLKLVFHRRRAAEAAGEIAGLKSPIVLLQCGGRRRVGPPARPDAARRLIPDFWPSEKPCDPIVLGKVSRAQLMYRTILHAVVGRY